MRFRDAPPNPQQPIRPGTEDKIMHASVKIGATELMASDGNCDDTPGSGTHTGYGLSITVDDPSQGEKTFNAICEGGNVVMPWQATFWSTGFGMVVDKFGVMWMVTNPHEGDKHAS
jgi:PhnB protein